MITTNTLNCPKCGGQLKFFDNVKRIVRTKARTTEWIDLRRFRCTACGSYKQYEAEVIIGVVEGLITCETLGFEDYPCEMTMSRWRADFANSFMER